MLSTSPCTCTSRSEEYLESTVQNTVVCDLSLACLAQHPSAFTSRRRTDKARRGALEPLPEDDARTKRFVREIPVFVQTLQT